MPCLRLLRLFAGIILTLFLAIGVTASPPKPLLLWPDSAPGAQGTEAKDRPAVFVYPAPADKANGTAVVVCPGGGYGGLASSYEGHDIARWFNTFGVTGLVLDYRHRGKGYGHPAPLQDAQRAIRLTRANAEEWHVDPKRVGIMGFSAGGHLASTAATHFDTGDPKAKDPIEQQSCRPDFAILCYPVIALGQPFGHHGTQQNLLGKNPDPALVASLSSARQVTPETPPTFLWSTWEDHVVPAENSIVFFQALKRAKVPTELHIFARGRHGLGLAKGTPGTELWPDLCRAWLLNQGVLEKP
jgi:acetyl esterase/lipase